MDGEALARVARLRPAAMQSKPVRVPRVFADPDAVLATIRARAPYPTMAAHHRIGDSLGWSGSYPWFKTSFDEPQFLQIPSFVEAAKQAFSASIVQPTHCLINIYGPMRSGPPHVDLPAYRGLTGANAPIWFLMNMTYSGLFHPWMVPIASGLAWFYDGEGGEFEYWPDGPEGAAVEERPPLWNVGVMSDNEFMWHRVGPIGPERLQERLHGRLRASDELHYAGEGAWEIRDGTRLAQRLAPEEVRLSILWKARVFRDADHLASFEDPSMNLDVGQAVEIYLEDLADRGFAVRRPADPFTDETWRKLLQEVYAPPFDGARAG